MDQTQVHQTEDVFSGTVTLINTELSMHIVIETYFTICTSKIDHYGSMVLFERLAINSVFTLDYYKSLRFFNKMKYKIK